MLRSQRSLKIAWCNIVMTPVPSDMVLVAAPPQKTKCVVLGIGNVLMSDDGAGVHIVRHLIRSFTCRGAEFFGDVDLVDGGTLGYLLIDRVSNADLMIVLDAANIGEAPGSFRPYEGDLVYEFLSDRQNRSVHEVGLIDLIQMMDLSGEAPKDLVLVGVQPESIDWGERLSPSVQKIVPIVAEEVERLLDAWIGHAPDRLHTSMDRETCP